jgi:hypothetical protein
MNGKSPRWSQWLEQVSGEHHIARLVRGYSTSRHTGLPRPQTATGMARMTPDVCFPDATHPTGSVDSAQAEPGAQGND